MNQWDLFDVHSGLCSMEDYLRQRHAEEDLETRIEVPEDQVTEFIKPPPPLPPPPARPEPEFQVQGEDPEEEPEAPSLDQLIQGFQSAARDWEERNQ